LVRQREESVAAAVKVFYPGSAKLTANKVKARNNAPIQVSVFFLASPFR
jgi:hypothetical protein